MSPPVSISNSATSEIKCTSNDVKNSPEDIYIQQHPDIAMIEKNNETYMLNSKKDRRNEFLTFDEPIFRQFFTKKITKELYLEQIHIPRRLNYPARFFENDLLELSTKTYWWTPPAVWFPSAAAMYMMSSYKINHFHYWYYLLVFFGICFPQICISLRRKLT